MIKYVETKVVCPFSVAGKAKDAVIRYVENNGEVVISSPNGCNDAHGSEVCKNCMETLHRDFLNGELKSQYSFK